MRRPSAHAILRWTARTFGDDAARRVFEPLVADWHREWCTWGNTRTGRLVLAVQGGAAFVRTCFTVGWQLSRPAHLPARGRAAALTTAFGFASLGAVALAVPFVLQADLRELRAVTLGTLAPSLFAITVPLSLLPAAATIRAMNRPAGSEGLRWFLVRLVFATSCLTCLGVGFVVPAANTHFRNVLASRVAGREAPPRGVRELSAVELARLDDTGEVFGAGTRERAREELTIRATIALVWPAAFACFGWRLAGARQKLSTRALLAWWAFALVATMLMVSQPRQAREVLGTLVVFMPAVVWFGAAAALRPSAATQMVEQA